MRAPLALLLNRVRADWPVCPRSAVRHLLQGCADRSGPVPYPVVARRSRSHGSPLIGSDLAPRGFAIGIAHRSALVAARWPRALAGSFALSAAAWATVHLAEDGHGGFDVVVAPPRGRARPVCGRYPSRAGPWLCRHARSARAAPASALAWLVHAAHLALRRAAGSRRGPGAPVGPGTGETDGMQLDKARANQCQTCRLRYG